MFEQIGEREESSDEKPKMSSETKLLRVIVLLIFGVIIVVLCVAPIWNGRSLF
jgi:hypothetical protein